MINKKIKMYIFIIIAILFVASIGYFMVFNSKKTYDYVPPEEFSNEKMRETVIMLYFYNTKTNKIEIENKKVDSKKLLNEPYKEIINLLIEKQENPELKSVIPENIKIKNVLFYKGIVYIDFSEEFKNLSFEESKNILNILLKTLNQLKEVQGIKATINDEEIRF